MLAKGECVTLLFQKAGRCRRRWGSSTQSFEPQNWRKALSRLVDNPIAHAALSVRQNVARWVEKDARAADRVIKREVKSVRKELGALAAEAQQMRKSGKQLESERASGRPESRSKGVDR